MSAASRDDLARASALASGPDPAPFTVVQLDDLAHVVPPTPVYWWDGYLPSGVVTMLAAHGGTGKSFIALMLAICITQGMPLFGVPTRRGKVAFFSAEDPANVVRGRVRQGCVALGVEVQSLGDSLRILDASSGDPVLFGARTGRTAGPTPTYAALQDYMEREAIDVLIVDNASDAYDASEIERAQVRAFVRSLACIAQQRQCAVLLLAHVDKGTSRGDRGKNTEGYSGSTAWHNSARSRLYMARDRDGSLVIEHQKHNLGRRRNPLRLVWPDGGVPVLAAPVAAADQSSADDSDTQALLRLLHERAAHGDWFSASLNGRPQFSALAHEKGYPKKRPKGELRALLNDAERRCYLQRTMQRKSGKSGHESEVWVVTDAGRVWAGIAPPPSQPSQPSPQLGDTHALGGPATAESAESGAGGMGGERTPRTPRAAKTKRVSPAAARATADDPVATAAGATARRWVVPPGLVGIASGRMEPDADAATAPALVT